MGFCGLVVPGFIGCDEAFMHRPDHFIESSELFIRGVEWRHSSLSIPTKNRTRCLANSLSMALRNGPPDTKPSRAFCGGYNVALFSWVFFTENNHALRLVTALSAWGLLFQCAGP